MVGSQRQYCCAGGGALAGTSVPRPLEFPCCSVTQTCSEARHPWCDTLLLLLFPLPSSSSSSVVAAPTAGVGGCGEPALRSNIGSPPFACISPCRLASDWQCCWCKDPACLNTLSAELFPGDHLSSAMYSCQGQGLCHRTPKSLIPLRARL